MNITITTEDSSPSARARIAGVFYLLSVLTAVLAEAFARGRVLYAVGLVPVLCFTAVTLLLYGIFKPVGRAVSLLAAFFNLASLALEALELHVGGMNIALVLHGVYCLLIAYLVFRSSFLPRILGALMALAGLAWMTSLSPWLAHVLHAYTQVLGFLGEGSLMVWLLARGVSVAKWNEKPLRTGHSSPT